METVVYTLTSLIDSLMGNGGWSDCSEYHFNKDRSELHLTVQGYGDTIDYLNNDDWKEDNMVFQDFYPLYDDETPEDLDDGKTPMRSHSYSSVSIQFVLSLPENRHRGDTYTVEEIRDMIKIDDYIDGTPGMGFTYYNWDEDEVD